MSERVIHPEAADPAVLVFVRANGVDPSDVVLEPGLTITDDRLVFTAYVRDANGRKRLDLERAGFLREERSVPLVASPEVFGL